MHPIMILWALIVVLVGWMLYTQVIVPASDTRIPYFPNFRKRAKAKADRETAAETLEDAEEDLAAALHGFETAGRLAYDDRTSAQERITKAQETLRLAKRRAKRLGITIKEKDNDETQTH